MEQDYDIGSTIRDKIIPHAVSWFTGEAIEADEFGELEDDDDEEEDNVEDFRRLRARLSDHDDVHNAEESFEQEAG
ncbi:Nucleosome assembly protein 1;3, partial [Mucuna pruriens]